MKKILTPNSWVKLTAYDNTYAVDYFKILAYTEDEPHDAISIWIDGNNQIQNNTLLSLATFAQMEDVLIQWYENEIWSDPRPIQNLKLDDSGCWVISDKN